MDVNPNNKQRYKIILEYIGTNYCGWQRQKDFLSLQQVVEDAIFILTKQNVEVTVSGRTDAGVHAYGQVAHFDLDKYYEPQKLMNSINHFMRPNTIGVIGSEIVDSDFHARFSAKSRHYVYKILNRKQVNIVNNGLKHWIRYPLNTLAMQEAANYCLGTHDFSSFRASECQARSPIKTIDNICLIKNEDDIEIYVSARSFLHHMIRNIVGSLIMVGKNIWSPKKFKGILDAKDRKIAGPTAPSEGLYFLKVDY